MSLLLGVMEIPPVPRRLTFHLKVSHIFPPVKGHLPTNTNAERSSNNIYVAVQTSFHLK